MPKRSAQIKREIDEILAKPAKPAVAEEMALGSWYRIPEVGFWVVVLKGMPEQAVKIGTGNSIREAWQSLEATPIQSAGRHVDDRALSWAKHAGWIDDIDALEDADAYVRRQVGQQVTRPR